MEDSWEQLKSDCAGCMACPLGQTRTKLVFGTGREDAEVLFVGEGPGEQEDLQGEPFVGPAGKLLDDMLAIVGLDRTKVYIANMVKCRPPRNRDPREEEMAACFPWLSRQMALLRPKLIVCLGRVAAKALMDPEFRITRQHGIWYDCQGVPIMATYHPSALLRDPARRPEAFMDLRELRKEIRAVCTDTELKLYDDRI